MSFTPAVLALGIILVFAALVYFAIKSSRTQQAEKNQQLRTLGFQAPESAPARLQSRINDLYHTSTGGDLVLQAVFHRQDLDQDLYIFDIIKTDGDGSELGQEVFGLISNQLALPRFSVITLPDFNREGLIGGLMDKMLDKVMDLAEKHLDLQRVHFPDQPEFQDRLVAFGRDPSTVRELLRQTHLSPLRDLTLPVQISGSGDLLTVDFSVSGTYGEEGEDLISQFNTFREITRVFMN